VVFWDVTGDSDARTTRFAIESVTRSIAAVPITLGVAVAVAVANVCVGRSSVRAYHAASEVPDPSTFKLAGSALGADRHLVDPSFPSHIRSFAFVLR
jgi:hypothetical protein